jgi:hypothetical protein
MATERAKLDKQILDLWSLCARTRDRKCRNCGKDEDLQAHHICQKTYKPTRYYLDNALTLCRGCHFPEKIRFEAFRAMVISVIGQAKYDRMHNIGYNMGRPFKYTISELRTIKAELQAKLKSLQSDYGELQ